MTKLLVKLFIKDSENTEDRYVRESYSTLSGVLGIISNLILFGIKLAIGLISGSFAITSDAFNNLSDTGTSFASIVSAKLSNKHPDKKHPYGYGKIEYLATFIVSFLIILVGVELFKSSFDGILHPEEVKMTVPLIIVLTLSISVKIWMYFSNRYLGRKINSALLEATAKDSLSDSLSTLVVVVASILTMFVKNIPFDGIFGVIVAALIIWNGLKLALEVAGNLIGKAPDEELVKKIKEKILAGDNILGVHDLIVHDYGPGRIIASAHAEVPADCNIMEIHEEIDKIENVVKSDINVLLVIHMDPVETNNPRVQEFKQLTENIVHEINPDFSIHDFRMTDGDTWINLIFDLVAYPEYNLAQREELAELVKTKLAEKNKALHAVIQVEA